MASLRCMGSFFRSKFNAGFTRESDDWQGFDVCCMLLLVLQDEELFSFMARNVVLE